MGQTIAALSLVLLWTQGSEAAIRSFAGPFDVQTDHVAPCDDSLQGLGLMTISRMKITRDRKNPSLRVASGRAFANYYYSDDLTLRVNIGAWSKRGGWRKGYFVRDFPRPCTFLKTFQQRNTRFFVDLVLGHHNFDCPLPPFEAEVTDFPLVFRQETFREFVYGKWSAELQIVDSTKNNVLLGCTRIEFQTIPRSDRTNEYDRWPEGVNYTDRVKIEPLPVDLDVQL